mgnify:CR=1 FL=1
MIKEPAPFILACSVCFGDPNSALSKGALAGVLFLGGTIGIVLAWIAITAWIWSRRAKNIDSASAKTHQTPLPSV